jgi:hypothetical protein
MEARGRSARLAVGTAAAISLLATGAGCGDDGGSKHASARPKTTADFTIPTTPSGPSVAKVDASERLTVNDGAAAVAKTERSALNTTRAAARSLPQPPPPPPADDLAAIRQALSDSLETSGWRGAQVEVLERGRTVNVALPRRHACDRDVPIGDWLTSLIHNSAPAARTLNITVAGTGLTLTAFRRSRCAAPRSGTGGAGGGSQSRGAGRVVYTTDGSGPFTTPEFAIAGRTWTVTYRNGSDFFQAFVVKNGRTEPFVINSTHRGSGTQTLHGPGRFKLKINSGDGWSVTVRDGA